MTASICKKALWLLLCPSLILLQCINSRSIKREFRRSWKKVTLGLTLGFALGWSILYFWRYIQSLAIPVFNGNFDKFRNTDVADELARNIRILCWVKVKYNKHEAAQIIKHTWGKRCNMMMFFSNRNNTNLPYIKVDFSVDHTFDDTKVVLSYLHEHNLLDSYDWFLNAASDMFVVMENLRYVLREYDPNEKYHFSATFSEDFAPTYMAGLEGFILSRAAAKNFHKIAVLQTIDMSRRFPQIPWTKYLSQFVSVDSDLLTCSKRKYLLPPNFEFKDLAEGEFYCLENAYYHGHELVEGCTSNSITFHKCFEVHLLELEFLLYGLQPYGISLNYVRNMTRG